jgi:hypothetical protein
MHVDATVAPFHWISLLISELNKAPESLRRVKTVIVTFPAEPARAKIRGYGNYLTFKQTDGRDCLGASELSYDSLVLFPFALGLAQHGIPINRSRRNYVL